MTNTMRALHVVALVVSALLAACSGGSRSTSATTTEPGSVLVVIDTRAGDDTLVQFGVGAATLEDTSGMLTGDVLAEQGVVTFDDPTGEPAGLRLRRVPSGDYAALHLVLVPGSGMALGSSGDAHPVAGPTTLRIEIASGLSHSELGSSWLVIGHDTAPMAGGTANPSWQPSLSARVGGVAMGIDELATPIANAEGVMTAAPIVDDSLLQAAASAACTYEDEHGTPYPDADAFRHALDRDDELTVDGTLGSDGKITSDRMRRAPRNDHSRLIGRIVTVDAAGQRFKFRVQATTRRGRCDLLAVPEEIVVIVSPTTRIETPRGRPLAFGDLEAGRLAKLEWVSRSQVPGQLAEYQVRRIVLPGTEHAAMHPQWQGIVQSVDLGANTLVVRPREHHTLSVNGVQVPQLDVRVVGDTVIERKPEHGGPMAIALDGVQVGDRAWVRGTVTGSQSIDAIRVRVRED